MAARSKPRLVIFCTSLRVFHLLQKNNFYHELVWSIIAAFHFDLFATHPAQMPVKHVSLAHFAG